MLDRARPAKLLSDLSSGQEKFKIRVYNEECYQLMDPNFKYFMKNIRREQHLGSEAFCDCGPGQCSTNKCSCWARSTIKIKVNLFEDYSTFFRTARFPISKKQCAIQWSLYFWNVEQGVDVVGNAAIFSHTRLFRYLVSCIIMAEKALEFAQKITFKKVMH
jgi:hypothetical protein